MLSWLRLPRRQASVEAVASEPQGLDAFTSEGGGPAADSSPEGQASKNLQFAVGFLMLVVLLQAYPSALWLRSGLRRSVDPAASSSPAEAPAPAAAAAAVPAGTSGCEPAPVNPTAVASSAPPASSPTAKVTPPAAPASPALVAGMLSVAAPVPLRVYLKGRLIGTTEAESTMLPQGTHELEFVNEGVGFRARRTVSIKPGATSSVKLDAPPGTMHINAVPWADVWIDGERIGETPIGNLQARIGSREVVFRHPELGERRTTVMVTLKEPVRISMDLRKK